MWYIMLCVFIYIYVYVYVYVYYIYIYIYLYLVCDFDFLFVDGFTSTFILRNWGSTPQFRENWMLNDPILLIFNIPPETRVS